MQNETYKLFSKKETCLLLGIGNTKFYELLRSGRLEAVKIGMATRVPATSLEKYVKNLPKFEIEPAIAARQKTHAST